jgi:S-DNA-T family DNA segregation ATPase FtsK/SpoIIIE
MDVILTVVAPSTGTVADLRVVCSDAAPGAPLLAALRMAVGVAPDETLTIDGEAVAADGSAADCHLADGIVVRTGGADRPAECSPTELVVTSGPDAGRRLSLTPGDHEVGRDPRCRLAINDRLVSRQHLLVSVGVAATTVTDLNSANGTMLDGVPLAGSRVTAMPTGSWLRIGDSDLRVVATSSVSPTSRVAVIHRAPRLRASAAAVAIAFPAQPIPTAPARIPILAAIAPLIAGVVLAVVLHQWQFLAFTALSPVMILGQAASDRRAARRTTRTGCEAYTTATSVAATQLAKALDDERCQRHAAAPHLADLVDAARIHGRLLWQRSARDEDAVVLRLGRGDLPSSVDVTGGRHATAIDVPVVVAMPELTLLGVCGPRESTTGLLRSLVVQATTLHSPEHLQLVVLAPGHADAWAWTRWLPHLLARGTSDCSAMVGFDDDQVAARLAELARRRTSDGHTPHVLVVVDGNASMRSYAALAALADDTGGDLSLIWCADTEHDLPGSARAVASLAAAPRPLLRLVRQGKPGCTQVVPDLLAAEVALATARTLAPLRDGGDGASFALPRDLRWEQLSDVDLQNRTSVARALTRLWSRGPSTSIPLGQGKHGTVTVDLCEDGPHALIAGTTGSGKSELLLSIVSSLAAFNRPDQLSLLLIDHKGGAAFGPFARLPHTVGVVTDLDAESTRRALLSLTAEIRRRETLFAALGATDLASYVVISDRKSDQGEGLARLVIVVDEFATLAEEQPDFVGGLVSIAQRGRSLGVHLILATQRPEGVVSADIRANTRLRICLGVARENESRDVIDCPDAVTISSMTPGRAYLRVGPGDLREFQAARIGGCRTPSSSFSVTVSPVATLGDPPPARQDRDDAEEAGPASDIDVLIAAALEVSERLGCVTPPPPWLPPLPDQLPTSTLPPPAAPRWVSWGMVDLPAAGRQRALELDLSAGATSLIAGTARSGRTTAALAIAFCAAAQCSPAELQLWAITADTGLAELATLGHCGAIIATHEIDRIEALLSHLSREVSRRRDNPDRNVPTLLLVIDSWEGLAAATDDRDGSRIVDALLRLAADGPAARLHTVITTDRAGLVGRLGSAATDKIVLRLADPSDYALIGMPGRDVPRRLPPGRGIRAADLVLVQVAAPDAATTAAAHRWAAPNQPPRRFDALPKRVSLRDVGRSPATDEIILGVRAEDLGPSTLARSEIGASFLIAGPPGSGRTTAAALFVRQLAGRPLAVSCTPGSGLLTDSAAIHLPRDDDDHAAALLDSLCAGSEPAPDVVVDDVDLLPDSALWARLEELIRNPAASDQVIVMTGSIDTLANAFRGPIAQARRAQTGILLCPTSPHDGEMFRIALPRRISRDDPPGRAWLASKGRATRLQLADPDRGTEDGAAPQPRTELELSGLGVRSLE